MTKPRVIIAETDINYIIPLQAKFVKDFFGQIDLEIITEERYFNELFSQPQKVEILIVADSMYDAELQKHNIANIFVMSELMVEECKMERNVVRFYKYTSVKEIFNEIVGKCANILNVYSGDNKETQIILVTSANGGTGKTTVAMGLSACLEKLYKRVLYINASHMQSFQYMMDNHTPISSLEIYTKLASPKESVYMDIKHIIRKEIFSYLPAFKATLISVGLNYSVYADIAEAAKNSNDFDYIIIDAESTFDENKTRLLDIADKVIIVTEQNVNSVETTNVFVTNVNVLSEDKYIFLCNNFDANEYNALIAPDRKLKFTISEYVEHFKDNGILKCEDLSKNEGIRKVAFLIM